MTTTSRPPTPTQGMPTCVADDTWAMHCALAQARNASAADEVPVGAVVVHDGRIIGKGHNTPIASVDPTAHAEIAALRSAARQLGNYRLENCTLYVTLEPCAMCAGAILNARVNRVVFGAFDPKAGAAGSVVDLFADARLNHQTRVQGGVLADSCQALLQTFFKARRQQGRVAALRDDALRTPDLAFQELPDFPWPPQYVNTLPALDGLRLHYLDEQSTDAARTWLCVHGTPTWSFAYRHLIAALLRAGQRVVALDLPGYGRSDKPKKERAHQLTWYVQIVQQLIDFLGASPSVAVGYGLGNTIVAHLWAAAAASDTTALFLDPEPQASAAQCRTVAQFCRRHPSRLTPVECAAYRAPFPDAGFEAALRVRHAAQTLTELKFPAPGRETKQARALLAQIEGSTPRVHHVTAHEWSAVRPMLEAPQSISIPPYLRAPEGAAALVSAALSHLNGP